jgi:hypothetical protein
MAGWPGAAQDRLPADVPGPDTSNVLLIHSERTGLRGRPIEIIYKPGTRDPSEMSDLVLKLLQEMREDGEDLQKARDVGIDVEAFLDEPVTLEEITIKPGKSGIDPISTVIVVTIVRPIVLDLWRKVLLPQIEARWGATAIGPEVKPGETPRKK